MVANTATTVTRERWRTFLTKKGTLKERQICPSLQSSGLGISPHGLWHMGGHRPGRMQTAVADSGKIGGMARWRPQVPPARRTTAKPRRRPHQTYLATPGRQKPPAVTHILTPDTPTPPPCHSHGIEEPPTAGMRILIKSHHPKPILATPGTSDQWPPQRPPQSYQPRKLAANATTGSLIVSEPTL